MRCPEEVLDTIGKRASGADAQPVVSPDEKAIGCNITCRDDCEDYKFSTNQCESHGKSDLDTIFLNVDSRDTKKLKFLIDTGAEISTLKARVYPLELIISYMRVLILKEFLILL